VKVAVAELSPFTVKLAFSDAGMAQEYGLYQMIEV
jgi:hypothetical protein